MSSGMANGTELADFGDLLLVAVTDYNPTGSTHQGPGTVSAPGLSTQLPCVRGELFSVHSGHLDWWIHVQSVESLATGFLPSSCVLPVKSSVNSKNLQDIMKSGGQVPAPMIYSNVNWSLFPSPAQDNKQDILDVIDSGKDCPERTANILSRITLWWLNWLIYTGYKRPLTMKDLWNLGDENTSNRIVPKFQHEWAKELKKVQMSQKKATQCDEGLEENETAWLKEDEDDVRIAGKSQPYQPSLVKAIIRVFWLPCLFSSLLKVVNIALNFTQPYLLRLLIEYSEDKATSPEEWEGYLYAVCMFVVGICQTLLLQHSLHICFTVAMRIRTAIVGSVFMKSLRLTNASRKQSTAGEMVNLMAVDTQKVMDMVHFFNHMWSAPLEICLAIYFLYAIMGVSVLAGVAVLVLLIPANVIITNKIKKLKAKEMRFKDERIKLINEILSGIKVLKLYAWEESFMARVQRMRGKELRCLTRGQYLDALLVFLTQCAPYLVSVATFSVYVLTGNELTATKAFVAISLFNILRSPLRFLPRIIIFTAQAQIAIKRLTNFLKLEECTPDNVLHSMPSYCSCQTAIHVDSGHFAWDRSEPATLQDINLNIRAGSLVAVVGQVGCGKSTLLSALLGETEKLAGQVYVKGSTAYVPQQAWIQHTSLRDNVLFGQAMRPDVYDGVVDACALKPDIQILPAGDMTEIGEKGINLSGGQKQRVSLARAVYFDADVYLLDDPLSAVDAHVGKHIFDKVIGPSGLLKNKSRVLVTHGVQFLSQMDQIIVLSGGRISEVGTYTELLENDGAFAEFLRTHGTESNGHKLSVIGKEGTKDSTDRPADQQDSVEILSGAADTTATPHRGHELQTDLDKRLSTLSVNSIVSHFDEADGVDAFSSGSQEVSGDEMSAPDGHKKEKGKMITEEKSETGRVKLHVFVAYARALGVLCSASILLFALLAESSIVGSRVWLAAWSSAQVSSVRQRDHWLGVYGAFGAGQVVSMLCTSLLLAFSTVRAAGLLHTNLLHNILHSPMAFFETVPLGRIVNRFSKDVNVIDEAIPRSLGMFLRTAASVVGIVVAISYSTPLFLAAVLPLFGFYFFAQRVYVASSRQLKRIESVNRSPIYSHFFETINGISTIRAFSQQSRFIRDNNVKVDEHQRAYYPSIASNRWIALQLEFVGAFSLLFAALFAVIARDSIMPGLVGLSISCALQITAVLNWMVRQTSELEANSISLERVKEYSVTPQEADWIVPSHRPPLRWPQEGKIEATDFCLRYRDGPLVLRNINLVVHGGEKIGIVGRTGAGKSSFTLALFRILERAGGKIVIDGVDISSIGLQDLRSRLTIIPQDPVLFSGSLRANLDPFEQHTDEELWRVLQATQLQEYVSGLPGGLQHSVVEGAENLSVGQRQLVCLARALLRHSKVLVLDEATAAVDLETDELIQQTIRREFADRTVLTIAHRLNTIMDYNRIMVLSEGSIVQFDSPALLLEEKGVFHQMACDAGLC